jgi:plasmid stabilization system protein ParE
MTRLIWTPAAALDLSRLHAFLAPKNRDAARRAARTIRQGVRVLATHPEMGRPIKDLPPEYREWFIQFGNSGYVVRYRYDGDQIAILAMRHGKEAGF